MKSIIESLESRIAPATIFFDPSQGSFKDLNTKVVKSDSSAISTGTSFALLLKSGDSLIMDETPTTTKTKGKNGKTKQVIDADHVKLATVTSGSALVFFTDLNGDSKVGKGELTGLAVTDGFKGSVGADVNGSILSALGSAKKGKVVFQGGNLSDDSIDELKVTGRVTGHILAGGSVSNVTVGGEGAGFSAQSIATGDAAAGITVSFNGGGKTFNTSAAAKGAGGSIQSITLAKGTGSIEAGSGNGDATGGSISSITIGSQVGDLKIAAGDGASNEVGRGGKGGSIGTVTISGLVGDLEIKAGIGGDGGENKVGGNDAGAGGSVTNVQVASLASGAISITGGDGGYGGYSYGSNYTYFGGAGGNGGAVSQVTISIAQDLEALTVAAGAGGNAQVDKSGGVGGAVSVLKVTGLGTIGTAVVTAGDGGNSGDSGGAGGHGGAVTQVELPAQEVTILAGHAGNSAGPFVGGNGGVVEGIAVTRVSGTVEIVAGDAGYAGYSENERTGKYTGAIGGTGGSVRNVTITGTDSGDSEDGFIVTAGSGGDGSVDKTGGIGGEVSNLRINLSGILDALSVTAGAGGRAPSGQGAGAVGAAGGSVTGLVVNAGSILGLAEIIAGAGGAGALGGGAGGSLSQIDLQAGLGGWGDLAPEFVAGIGGEATPAGANGTVADNVLSNYVAPVEEIEEDEEKEEVIVA